MGGLHIRYRGVEGDFGGANRLNRAIAETLRKNFTLVDRPESADLQVCSLEWDAPSPPRRLFIDHGSFADAGFWASTAPRLSTADAIFVSSEVCVRVAERILAEPRPALKLVPYFADTDLFTPPADRAGPRRSLDREGTVPSDGPLLLEVSGYSRRKNLHLALRFLHALHDLVPRARLAIVGRPDASHREYAASLDSLAEGLGIADRVHRIDTMPHARLRTLMAASDLMVHLTTCRLENFGLVVAEAMASGLPVVAADWGGLRDLVVPGETGLLARTYLTRQGPRCDWLSQVEGATALLGDPDAWRSASQRAAARARTHLSHPAFEGRLCRAVREILDQPPSEGRPVRLTDRGQDLMFATLRLYRAHPEISSTGDEYRLLLRSDGGESCRFLTGPAATSESPPPVGFGDRLYPVVSFRMEGNVLHVADPAWPAAFDVPEDQSMLLALADGRRTLAEVAALLPRALGDPATILQDAEALVDRGVLCPRSS